MSRAAYTESRDRFRDRPEKEERRRKRRDKLAMRQGEASKGKRRYAF